LLDSEHSVDAPLDKHLQRIRTATPKELAKLLDHFVEQCDPLNPSDLRPIRPGRVPDEEWESSPEHAALSRMLGRCWPTEQAQNH
jgi:hypothetical protein